MAAAVLTVVGAVDLPGGRRRLRLVSEADGFACAPGERLALRLGEMDLPPGHIRDFDPVEERLEIEFILQGDTPATRWVKAASLGDRVVAEDGAVVAAA